MAKATEQQEEENTYAVLHPGNIAEIHSYIVDVALYQYANQWSRVGNQQTSAGSLLAVVSIAMTVGFTSIPEKMEMLKEQSLASVIFCFSFIATIAAFLVSAFCMIQILKSKSVYRVKDPVELRNDIDGIVEDNARYGIDAAKQYVVEYIISAIDDEIKNVDGVMDKTRYWYEKCLYASFVSLANSIAVLLLTKMPILSSFIFQSSVTLFICIFIVLLVVCIFLFPRRN